MKPVDRRSGGTILSVVLPAFNVEHYIGVAPKSAFAQWRSDEIQFIVVDDGSTDGTLQQILKVSGHNTTVIHHDNQGVSAARNAGIARAKSRYIGFLDSDDEWAANFTDIVMPMLDADTADIIEFNVNIVDVVEVVNDATMGLRTNSIAPLLLPFASFAITAAINHSMIGGGALTSFQDRFENTWPLLLQGMLRENLIWFGIGPGGFGAAANYYHSSLGFNVGYADNITLYAIADFGVFGVLLFTIALSIMLLSSESEDRGAWTMLVFLLISGITMDIFESVGCLLFFGAAARTLWLNAQGQHLYFNPGFVLSVRDRKSTSLTSQRNKSEFAGAR